MRPAVLLGCLAVACASVETRPSLGVPSTIDSAELAAAVQMSKTVRVPGAERILKHLVDGYVDPERVGIAAFRQWSATALYNRIPELAVWNVEASETVVLAVGDRRYKVSCPAVGPAWGFVSCLRRMAAAVVELCPDVTRADVDRTLGDSLTSGLDPHSRNVWVEASPCRFSPDGCPSASARIGLRLQRIGPDLVVVSVTPKSPAASADLAVEDRIHSIDGIPTTDLGAEEGGFLLSGAAGSPVVLSVERPGSGEREVTITRREVADAPLVAKRVGGGSVGYIAVPEFDAGVADEVEAAMKALGTLDGLILDLRNNPGGLVREALRIANLFVTKGRLIVVVSRDGERDSLAASSKVAARYPLIVLLNARSASASELLASTLQDNLRAVVVGERSFGKGSMQTPMALPGGVLMMTTQRYLSSDAKTIQGRGVTPDVSVRIVNADRDRLRLRHWPVPSRESDRANALGAKWSHDPAAAAPLSIRILHQPGTDSLVELAATLLSEAGHRDRARMVTSLAAKLPQLAAKAEREIEDALATLNLAGALAAAAEPTFTADLKLSGAVADAGSEALIWLRVQNTGAVPLAGLSAHLESDNPLLDGREIAVGDVAAGATSITKIKVLVPLRAIERTDPVRVMWHAAGGRQLESSPPLEKPVHVRASRAPDVALVGWLDDGDGAVAPGESVKLCAKVKNFGAAASPKLFVSVYGRAGPIEDWARSFATLPPVAPGAETKVCFDGVGRAGLERGQGKVSVFFGEHGGRILGSRDVVVATKVADRSPPQRGDDWGARVRLTGGSSLLVDGATAAVAIDARAYGGALRDLTLFVDGRKVAHERFEPGTASSQIVRSVPVAGGSSVVRAVVRGIGDTRHQDVLRVYRITRLVNRLPE